MRRRSRTSPVPALLPGLAAALAGLALLAGCSGDEAGGERTEPAEPTTATTGPDAAPAFTPITGGTDDDGDPRPPPVHAVLSVVVRGDTSWAPYAGKELTGLDTEAADAIADRLGQVDQLLTPVGIPASIELSYGAASALCAEHPDLLDELEDHGHVLGIHALTNGDSFRARSALGACGRTPATASGLASMADPVGPRTPTAESLADAIAVLSIQDLTQVVGTVSPLCTDLGLASHTNNYGTGAFTAPWRSAWIDGNACADSPAGRIVVVDQVPLVPGSGDERVDAGAVDAVGTRATQTLGWAADQRYKSPEELPAPGMLTWGITMRLDDLTATAADDGADDADTAEDAAEDTGDDTDEDAVEAPTLDPRTAPLDPDTLSALGELLTELQESVAAGRWIWLTPDATAEILRPS